MPWLKNVVLDIVCTALIAVYALLGTSWSGGIRWFILIYTPLMLVLKLAALAVGPGTLRGRSASKKLGTQAPQSFFHVAYALNVLLLLYAQWWIMAAAWALIWIFSFVFERRNRPSS